MPNAWVALVTAGIFEIVWAVGLKYTDGFTKLVPSVITVVFSLASFYLLAYAMEKIPLGTSYAIWVGIGAVGTLIAGILLFDEHFSFPRIVFASLIIIGILGLKLCSD